jgi:hypothetical protein
MDKTVKDTTKKIVRAIDQGKDKEARAEVRTSEVGIRKVSADRSAVRRLTSASPLITIEARRSFLGSKDSSAYLKAVNITTAEVVAAVKLRISAEVSNTLANQPK